MPDRPTDEQIEAVIDESYATDNRWPSMSYEDGVRSALSWAKGDVTDNPFEEN